MLTDDEIRELQWDALIGPEDPLKTRGQALQALVDELMYMRSISKSAKLREQGESRRDFKNRINGNRGKD